MSQLNKIDFYLSQKQNHEIDKNDFFQSVSENTSLEEVVMNNLCDEEKDNDDEKFIDDYEDIFKLKLNKNEVFEKNKNETIKNKNEFTSLLKKESNGNYIYLYPPTTNFVSFSDFQNDKSWGNAEEELRCLQENVQTRYKEMLRECEVLAQSNCVFLYAIPSFKRNGKPNKPWRGCELVYYERNKEKWCTKEMTCIWNDLIDEDSVFRCLLPKNIAPTIFFLKDKYSNDRDHPYGNWGEKEKNFSLEGNYYHLNNNHIVALRDGETTQGNKLLSLGISIRFEESICKDSEWYGCVLHYLLSSDGIWYDKHFNKHGFVFLLECRSTTFVIRNRNSTKWLRSIDGTDFHISFPGAYVVYGDGKIIECSFIHLNKFNFVSNNCNSVSYKIKDIDSNNTKSYNSFSSINKEIDQNKVDEGSDDQEKMNKNHLYMNQFDESIVALAVDLLNFNERKDIIEKIKKGNGPEVYSINTPPTETEDVIDQHNNLLHGFDDFTLFST